MSSDIPLDEQIACVQRELKMRTRVYARLVEQHKMADLEATREIATMQAVLETLRGLAGQGELLL